MINLTGSIVNSIVGSVRGFCESVVNQEYLVSFRYFIYSVCYKPLMYILWCCLKILIKIFSINYISGFIIYSWIASIGYFYSNRYQNLINPFVPKVLGQLAGYNLNYSFFFLQLSDTPGQWNTSVFLHLGIECLSGRFKMDDYRIYWIIYKQNVLEANLKIK